MTSENKRSAMQAKEACAREVREQLVTYHSKLGRYCESCADATEEQVIALSIAVDQLMAETKKLAEQIIIGSMPIEWRGEERDLWIRALRDEELAAALILRPCNQSAMPEKTLDRVNERQAKFAEWNERIVNALEAIEKHNPIMGFVMQKAVNDYIR